MSWDGENDRRSRPRDKNDLDFTWQDAFYSMRREFHQHTENFKQHVEHNAEQEKLRQDQYAGLDAKMDDMLVLKNQISGGLRVIALLGAGLLSVISFMATFWDQIMAFGHKVFSK